MYKHIHVQSIMRSKCNGHCGLRALHGCSTLGEHVVSANVHSGRADALRRLHAEHVHLLYKPRPEVCMQWGDKAT